MEGRGNPAHTNKAATVGGVPIAIFSRVGMFVAYSVLVEVRLRKAMVIVSQTMSCRGTIAERKRGSRKDHAKGVHDDKQTRRPMAPLLI